MHGSMGGGRKPAPVGTSRAEPGASRLPDQPLYARVGPSLSASSSSARTRIPVSRQQGDYRASRTGPIPAPRSRRRHGARRDRGPNRRHMVSPRIGRLQPSARVGGRNQERRGRSHTPCSMTFPMSRCYPKTPTRLPLASRAIHIVHSRVPRSRIVSCVAGHERRSRRFCFGPTSYESSSRGFTAARATKRKRSPIAPPSLRLPGGG